MRFAVIADIHGNARALRAVLADMDALGVAEAVNLGDFFSGPLDADETAALLAERNYPSIRGNHDRYLITQAREDMGLSDGAAFDLLSETHLDWIRSLPETLSFHGDVFLCHGTPTSDQTYWLERVNPDGSLRRATLSEIEAEAKGIGASLILCAHTHLPRIVHLSDGRLIVNPGSVGCPAYDDDHPVYHCVETGTPNASYAIVEKTPDAWTVTFRSIPYASTEASALAAKNVRAGWARALATGWISEASD
ncbi:metallophosphoesterase family protein [Donghicola tyrosinivorans]|nr:metallophosphoesterase family protein [Donghicola tyrosinivorans]